MSLKRIVLLLSLLVAVGPSSSLQSAPFIEVGNIQDARQVPFDNTTNGFVANEVQSAIEEINDQLNNQASPGFTWGDSGNINNSYLLNDNVFSNKAGRIIPVDGSIVTISIAAENTSTATIWIRRRTDPGPVFTTIATLAYGGARKATASIVSPPAVTTGDELVAYVDGQAKNPVVSVVIQGNF